VKRVFDSEQAQLGGISDEPGLFIDFALHKAWIRVDEEGTEAAAATMEDAGGMGMVGESVVVNADHPFLFAIRDRATNALLFLGRLAKPPAAQVLARDE
jgi:serpin B